MKNYRFAEAAYNGYCWANGDKFKGTFEKLPDEIKDAWALAAEWVIEAYVRQ